MHKTIIIQKCKKLENLIKLLYNRVIKNETIKMLILFIVALIICLPIGIVRWVYGIFIEPFLK